MYPIRNIPTAVLILLFSYLFGVSSSLAQSGTGLTGQYYDETEFSSLKTTRIEGPINFNFGSTIPPGTGITHADSYSIVWSGQVDPEFNSLYTFYVTADDGARLWINDQLVVCRTFVATDPEMRGQVQLQAGQRVNIRLEYIELTGNASVKLEWSCGSRAREVIPQARLYPARVAKVGGSLMKEHWMNLPTPTYAGLISHTNYPDKPNGREFITSFECLAQNWANNYGTRVTGYIVPPVSGTYSFAVSGATAVQLYLSTDENEANKGLTPLVSVASATAFRAWGTAATRALIGGKRYYVELMHVESSPAGTSSPDHWSVGWEKPGDTTMSVIPGSALVQPRTDQAQPAQANLLDKMSRDHPRIFASPERCAKLRASYQSAVDSKEKQWATQIIGWADTLLLNGGPVVVYPVEERVYTSREFMNRIYILGLSWQLTHSRDPVTNQNKYAEQALKELNRAKDVDWSTDGFLGDSEIMNGYAIGYDWLYDYWTTTQRETFLNTLISKGLNAGMANYVSNSSWTRSDSNNWNPVCNGSLAIVALAVGTDGINPTTGLSNEVLTEDILNRALNSVRPIWKRLTADNGLWFEGPGYWSYAIDYGTRMCAALESVLGSDFGLSTTTNFSETGFFPLHNLGTSDLVANFGDDTEHRANRPPASQWLARRFNQPLFNWWKIQGSLTDDNGQGPLELLWYNDSSATPNSIGASPDMAFHGEAGTPYLPQEVVTLRGRWDDTNATYVISKGGVMGLQHTNLDAGSFVLDARGKRWFVELGRDDYDLPGFFELSQKSGNDRWDYYRTRAEGQNTLVITNPGAGTAPGPDMKLGAVAPLIAYQSEPRGTDSFAIHDLTPVYADVAMTKVWRGTRLLGARDQVLLQDEIQASTSKQVRWSAHYKYNVDERVSIDPSGKVAILKQGNERLYIKILQGSGQFVEQSAAPPATPGGQNPNSSYRKLEINFTTNANTLDRLAVWFVPLGESESAPTNPPTIEPLENWSLTQTNHTPIAIDSSVTSTGGGALDLDLRNYVTDDKTSLEQLLFSIISVNEGAATLSTDGYTVHFVPTAGYTGTPTFTFRVTDSGGEADTLLAWDFDLPATSDDNVVPDVSGQGRVGSLTGAPDFNTLAPARAGAQGARAVNLIEPSAATTSASAVPLSRVITGTELDWNTQNWTVAGWFNRRDLTNEDIIWHIGNGDGFGGEDALYLYCPANSSRVRLEHYRAAVGGVSGGKDIEIYPTTPIAPGTWYHFAIVSDGGTLKLYINGESVGSDSTYQFSMSQASPMVVGGHASTTSRLDRWFDGGLDELLVSKAALTASQIQSLAGGLSVRHFGSKSSTATIELTATAANYRWTKNSTATGLNWSNGANWQSDLIPVSSRGATLEFFTPTSPTTTLVGGVITATYNLLGTAPFQLNTLTLAGASPSTAATTVNLSGGRFSLFNNGPDLPKVNLVGDSFSTTYPLTYNVSADLTLNTTTTFKTTNDGTFIFSGAIDGSGELVYEGTSGKLILAGNNTYSGATTISDGRTLQIGNDGTTGSLGQGAVNNDGQLRFDRSGSLAVPNTIVGNGSVYLDGTGTIALLGDNTFTGDVTVNRGILRITHSKALGDHKTIVLTNDNAQLLLDNTGSSDPVELPDSIDFLTSNDDSGAIFNLAGNNVLHGRIVLTSGGGSSSFLAAADTLTFNGPITTNTTGRSIKLHGAANGLINGVITDGDGANVLKLEKNDAGTWTLSGKNTYSGKTSLKAGTLKLGNSTALGHGGFTWNDTDGAIDDDGGTTLTSGATLDLNGQTDVIEKITLNGTGTSGQGALINSNTTKAASIAGGYVSTLVVTAGSIHSSVPTVSITGGGGTLATASARLGLTDASVTVNASTSSKIAKYSVAPSVSISGGGSPSSTATATALLDPTTGVVTGIKIGFSGSGYTLAPTFSFSGGTQKGGGSFAADTVYPTATGNKTNFTVVALQVTKSGSGYTSVPTVSFNNSNSTTSATVFMSSLLLASTETSIGGPGDIVINPEIKSDNSAYTRTLTKVGSGTVALKGATRGNLAADEGILELYSSLTGNVTVSGTFAQYGPVTGNVSVAGGTFIHSDTVTGNVSVANGGLEQLDGALNVTGNYTLGSTSADTDSTLRVQLRNATTSDKLTVNGTVTLRGKLDVEIASGASLPLDSTIAIIDKTSTGTINTRFANRANDSTFTVGKYTFRINYNVGGNNVVLKVESISSSPVTTVPTLLEQWRVTNFGSSVNGGAGRDDADPDGDSFTNFFEYAMGTDPWSRDVGSAVQTQVDAADKLQISFLRARSDVKYIVEVANSLAVSSPWQPLITDPGSVSLTVRVTVTDTIPVSTIQQRYLRLRMESK